MAVLGAAILLVFTVANATWVYNRHTVSGEVTSNFWPTVTGNHYHQAKAPATGWIESKVYDSNGGTDPVIDQVDNGDCQRNMVSLSAGATNPHQLYSNAEVTSGTAEA